MRVDKEGVSAHDPSILRRMAKLSPFIIVLGATQTKIQFSTTGYIFLGDNRFGQF